MRASQKIELLDRIAVDLSNRYDRDDIGRYLNHSGVITDDTDPFFNPIDYVKSNLHSCPDNVLVEIAEDLEIPLPAARRESLVPPKSWPDASSFRLFISHISKDKGKATRLRDCLVSHHVSGFVAHQDIQPTLEWQREIESALHCMDAFVAIHTAGFSASVWTQQEIGFAVARGVKIISLKFDEDPTGFISRQQALPRLDKKAEDIAKEICAILSSDPLSKERFDAIKKAKATKIDDDEIPF